MLAGELTGEERHPDAGAGADASGGGAGAVAGDAAVREASLSIPLAYFTCTWPSGPMNFVPEGSFSQAASASASLILLRSLARRWPP